MARWCGWTLCFTFTAWAWPGTMAEDDCVELGTEMRMLQLGTAVAETEHLSESLHGKGCAETDCGTASTELWLAARSGWQAREVGRAKVLEDWLEEITRFVDRLWSHFLLNYSGIASYSHHMFSVTHYSCIA